MSSHRHSIWTFAILAIAAAVMSGCVQTPTDQYPLSVLEPIETSPTVQNMKVVNGAGETLYDGPRPKDGQITANPTPEQLDGTMTITRTYSDGSTKQQTLTYDAGKPVKIGYSSASNDYYVETPPPPAGMPRFYGGFDTGFESLNRPDTQIVRRDEGGRLAGFVKADNDSSAPALKGTVGFRVDSPLFGVLGRKWGLELQGSYHSSDANENFEMIRAGTGSLAVFGPLGGGGANLGNNDITDLRYSSDYTAWSIQPRFSKSYGLGTIGGRPLNMNSYIGFSYGKNEDDQELSGNVPGLGVDFMSGSWIDNWYYGPEFGFDSAWYCCSDVKLKVGGFVNFNVNDLKAKRMIQFSNGLNGSDEFSDTEFTVGGGARVGLNFKIAPWATAKVGYEFEYANNAPVVNVDRQTGEASVDAKAADIHRIKFGFRLFF